MRCYIFDIDGTPADCSHRRHFVEGATKDWDAFFYACSFDTPIEHICQLARQLHPSVFVTGRPERIRKDTVAWLVREKVLPDIGGYYGTLYMRDDGDHRPDYIVKREILDRVRADGHDPIMAFDDRDSFIVTSYGYVVQKLPSATCAHGTPFSRHILTMADN